MFPHYGERLRFIHGQSHIHHPAAVKTLQSIKFDLTAAEHAEMFTESAQMF